VREAILHKGGNGLAEPIWEATTRPDQTWFPCFGPFRLGFGLCPGMAFPCDLAGSLPLSRWWCAGGVRGDLVGLVLGVSRGPKDFREKVLTVDMGCAWSGEARRRPPSEKTRPEKNDTHRKERSPLRRLRRVHRFLCRLSANLGATDQPRRFRDLRRYGGMEKAQPCIRRHARRGDAPHACLAGLPSIRPKHPQGCPRGTCHR